MKIYWNGHSKNIIGNRLKELRTAQGISQKTLAARLQTEDNVMSLIRRIRKKIEPDPSKPIYVLTVWGIGYKFNNAIKRK